MIQPLYIVIGAKFDKNVEAFRVRPRKG